MEKKKPSGIGTSAMKKSGGSGSRIDDTDGRDVRGPMGGARVSTMPRRDAMSRLTRTLDVTSEDIHSNNSP